VSGPVQTPAQCDGLRVCSTKSLDDSRASEMSNYFNIIFFNTLKNIINNSI
jgi:hypothetical protein